MINHSQTITNHIGYHPGIRVAQLIKLHSMEKKTNAPIPAIKYCSVKAPSTIHRKPPANPTYKAYFLIGDIFTNTAEKMTKSLRTQE